MGKGKKQDLTPRISINCICMSKGKKQDLTPRINKGLN
jgi:hypothetical protein